VSMITSETQANDLPNPLSLPISSSPRRVPRIIIIPAISPFTTTGSISLSSVVVTAKPTIPIHENRREKQREKRGPPTMSNIAGLFHPWEREPERGVAHRGGSRQGLETRVSREGVQRREEHRSISVPPPSPFRHSHFSPRSALHHSASHPPSFVPLSFLLPLCL